MLTSLSSHSHSISPANFPFSLTLPYFLSLFFLHIFFFLLFIHIILLCLSFSSLFSSYSLFYLFFFFLLLIRFYSIFILPDQYFPLISFSFSFCVNFLLFSPKIHTLQRWLSKSKSSNLAFNSPNGMSFEILKCKINYKSPIVNAST